MSPATSATSPSSASARSPARAVQVHGELARRLGIEQLAEPRGNHAGQEVAGAAGRHPGVAGQVDERAIVRRRQ